VNAGVGVSWVSANVSVGGNGKGSQCGYEGRERKLVGQEGDKRKRIDDA
jgi:hypothetical protein